jgi:transcription initiation factor TFIID TATA-box-binding protein
MNDRANENTLHESIHFTLKNMNLLNPPSQKRQSGVRITNVISHSHLGCRTDLGLVAVALNGRANPRVFPACMGHCQTTRTTQSVFQSGKMVVVGAKSEEEALLAAYYYARALCKELKLPVNIYNFEINNVVGDFRLGYPLNLDLFFCDNDLTALWDPENFKGLSYKPLGSEKGVVSFVLFESGKGILTGGKSSQDLYEAYQKFAPGFARYKKGEEYRQLRDEEKRQRPWFATFNAKNRKRGRKQRAEAAAAAAAEQAAKRRK